MNESRYYQIHDLFPQLKFPNKYKGTRPVTMRSSWETRFALWCDRSSDVLEWSSENVVIPYFLLESGRQHRYFVDFWMKVRQKDGSTKEFLVEVKPKAECSPPKQPKNTTKSYINRVKTYMKNQAKWKAAEAWCENRRKLGTNIHFTVVTEEDLGIR